MPESQNPSSSEAEPPAPPIDIPEGYTEESVRERFWPKFKRVASKIPGVGDILALYYYFNSGKAPLRHRAWIIGSLAYFIMPMDLIPDFMGAFGYTDDIAVALALVRFIGGEVMKPYRVYARRWLRGEVEGDPTDQDLEWAAKADDSEIIDVKPLEVTREP